MMLHKTKKIYKSKIRKELGKNPTAEDVLTHLFGDQDGWINSNYSITEYETTKVRPIHRINAIWVYPIYFLLIAPVRWVIFGQTGVKTTSKFYSILEFLLGDPK